jgi:hypothetical protein
MKWNLLLLLISFASIGYGQKNLTGQIKDKTSKEALPYCHVANQTTGKVSLTNEDGIFRIATESPDDKLVITFIGYNALTILAKDFPKNGLIYLTSNSIKIDEMLIVANDEFLYKLLEKCRKKIRYDNKEKSSKTYLRVETMTENEPIEMIESYYNGFLRNATVNRLLLKNGRVGLTKVDSSAFVSLGTTQALAKLNLTESSQNYPDIPLQFRGRKLRKKFILKRLSNDAKDEVIHFEFTSKQKKQENFEGEIWIHKKTAALLKIILKKQKAKKHPFAPIHPGSRIAKVSLEITQNFNFDGKSSQLSHINLNYDLTFIQQIAAQGNFRVLELRTESLLHFYDYQSLFTLPYYSYLSTHDDYRKISISPPNPVFWDNNTGMVFSKKEQERLAFLKKEGTVLNFQEDFNGKPFFEHNNIFWNKRRRISALNIPIRRILTTQVGEFANARTYYSMKATARPAIVNEPFFFDIQLFMDINTVQDTLHYNTATILDIFGTYNNLPKSDTMSCMVNILFDLCEMERLKLVKSLKTRDFSHQDADKVYRKANEKLNSLIQKYSKAVFRFDNFDIENMIEWNEKVIEGLGIDNMLLFNLYPPDE